MISNVRGIFRDLDATVYTGNNDFLSQKLTSG